jgi:predicted phage gp36 major capsid-like protein
VILRFGSSLEFSFWSIIDTIYQTIMSAKEKEAQGGFHFGNVGRDAKMNAGGDIVAGDKHTVTTTSTTIQSGFQSEEQKQEFQKQLEALREALRDIKAKVEASAGLSADEKDELTTEILQHVKALKEVKETTAELPPGQKVPADIGKMVETNLEKANGILEKVQAVAKKSAELAANVGEFALKYGPLVLSARHLFGLP